MKELTALDVLIPLQPRILAVVETCQSIGDNLERLRLLTNAYNLTRLNGVRRNVYNSTVYTDVLVSYQLTSSCTSRSNTETIYNVVEASLQILQQDLTGNTGCTSCLLEHSAKLLL
jgi:hypothetical protein